MSTSRVAAKSRLPPGLPAVAAATATNLFPAALVVAAARVLSSRGVDIGTVWIVLAAFLSLPLAFAWRIVYRDWSFKRRAAAMGAVLPPSRVGKRIGNVDILKKGVDAFNKNGWPGAYRHVVDLRNQGADST